MSDRRCHAGSRSSGIVEWPDIALGIESCWFNSPAPTVLPKRKMPRHAFATVPHPVLGRVARVVMERLAKPSSPIMGAQVRSLHPPPWILFRFLGRSRISQLRITPLFRITSRSPRPFLESRSGRQLDSGDYIESGMSQRGLLNRAYVSGSKTKL